MRTIGILALLIGLLMAPALAQGGPGAGQGPAGPGGMHHGMRRGGSMQNGILRFSQQLDLTQDQQTQIRGLLKTQRQQAQSIRQNTSLTPEQKQDKIKQLRQSTHQQVLGVLTPDQQAKLKELQKQRGGGMAALNLTPEQKAKLQPIRQQMRQQVQAVRQDSSLTPEQKQDKIRQIRQDAMAQMNSILTPEQQQQLQERFQQMRQRRGRPGEAPPPPPGS